MYYLLCVTLLLFAGFWCYVLATGPVSVAERRDNANSK
ncbi:hypothetical protein ZK1_18 [Klebsiella phage vB_KpnP_ZK1]|nr:hypothetical protein ZK1_18 [Klebsiella phage vB_KpnP_ZK1]